jgi:hypothetical protein
LEFENIKIDYLSLSDAELMQLLHDDVPCGDLTTEVSGIGGQICW